MKIDPKAERRRIKRGPWASPTGAKYGAFALELKPGGAGFRILISSTDGWDHVSVSLPERSPNWGEMCAIKALFFAPDEVVMQLHSPAHRDPCCLHLWRPRAPGALPLPPERLFADAVEDERKAVRR